MSGSSGDGLLILINVFHDIPSTKRPDWTRVSGKSTEPVSPNFLHRFIAKIRRLILFCGHAENPENHLA